ncbi:sulfatase family protein [Halopiger thermotolerans]
MARSQRPTIVLVHCHDLGKFLGCYGAAVDTPRIDAFAADGVRFDRHFVTAPQCSPSRSSLQTGRYPHQNGMLGLAHGEWELDSAERLLPELLGEAGYETHLFGLQHVTEHLERLGYDRIHANRPLTPDTPPSTHESARARDVAAEFADFLEAGGYDAPFFASVGFFELHRVAGDGFGFESDRYGAPDPATVELPPFLPDRPGIRSDVAGMHGMLAAIDDGVGTVLDALEDAGLADETLVVFTTEHGLAMPRAKGSCFDRGIEAALLLRGPGVADDGLVVDDLVSNVDVFATLLEFADAPRPERTVAGRSVVPLLADGANEADEADAATDRGYEPRDHVFAEMTWHDRYNPIRAVRTDRWKYVRNVWRLPAVSLTRDVYCSDAGREVREECYGERRPYAQLYDLEVDPLEERNLLADGEPADADALAAHDRLRAILREWMERTDDPLLEGPVLPSDWEDVHPWTGDG